jgi:hypothetical protein
MNARGAEDAPVWKGQADRADLDLDQGGDHHHGDREGQPVRRLRDESVLASLMARALTGPDGPVSPWPA